MTAHKGIDQARRLKELGFRFEAVARMMGVHYAHFSYWMNGRKNMPDSQAEKIDWLLVRLEPLVEEFRRTWRQPHDNVS